MSRLAIRTMKRTLAAGSEAAATSQAGQQARQSALGLLERSVRFGHHRLAILRLATAVESGATPSGDHWIYCRRVATASADESLRQLFLGAAIAAGRQHPPEPTQQNPHGRPLRSTP